MTTARPALVALALALAGCASAFGQAGKPGQPGVSARLLARADEQMAAARYRNAASLYDEFLRANPGEPEAARVRATRTLLERLLLSETEVDRLQREVTRLKADLERLRSIDLQRAPGTR